MAACIKCGAPLGAGAVFCGVCGSKQDAPPVQPVMSAPPPVVPQNQPAPSHTPGPKKMSGGMIAVISVLLVGLIVVGSLYGMGVGKLNKANASNDTLQTELTAEQALAADLETQLTAAKNTAASLTSQLASANSDLAAAKANVTSLTSDVAAANAKVTGLTADLATANGKVTSLTADLATANAKAATLQTQLSAIQAKYPLKDFPDYATFAAWVRAHVQPVSTTYAQWYANALKMQSLAAEDGYYVSACWVPGSWTNDGYVQIYNTALVANTLYIFDAEDYTYIYSMGVWNR